MAQEHIKLQKQVRDNALEVDSYMRDLNNWATDVMADELVRKLPQDPADATSVLANAVPVWPAPIRGTGKTCKSQENASKENSKENNPQKKQKRIVGSDYSAWEKFDVEEACKEIDKSDSEDIPVQLESEDDIVRKKALGFRSRALLNKKKELGNKCMQEKNYKLAITYYTDGIALDPQNAILPANRAQAHLNINEYGPALRDCDIALGIDPGFVKAYFRRARAKIGLGDTVGAQIDLKKTLNLEPQNKEARTILDNLDKCKRKGLTTQQGGNVNKNNGRPQFTNYNNKSQGQVNQVPTPTITYPRIVEPIDKPLHLQSKRSLFSVYVKIKGEEKENKIRRVDSSALPNWSWSNGGGPSSNTSAETTPSTSNISTPMTPDLNELNLSDSFQTMRVGNITVPEKPKSSVEFTTHWKQLKPYSTSAAQYLQQMKAEDYLLFEDTMESSILSDILDTLVWEFIPRKWDFTENLEGLTKVRRLKTLILFLTEKDRANARKLISLCTNAELKDFYLTNYNF